MAYFANGMDGNCFTRQCEKCILGDKGCPIFGVQYMYNYEACNNKTARAILDDLVSNSGECAMFCMFPEMMKVKETEKKELYIAEPIDGDYTQLSYRNVEK